MRYSCHLSSGIPYGSSSVASSGIFRCGAFCLLLCWFPFHEQNVGRWRLFLLIVAVIQLPFALYELIALVPMREGLRDVVPIDVVAGTFGATLYGGGASGEMATFLIIVLAFLLAQRMERILTSTSARAACLAGSNTAVPG